MSEREDTINTVLISCNNLLHNLQTERGISSLFLDSEGKIFRDELIAQTAKTDKLYIDLLAIFASVTGSDWLSPHLKSRIREVESNLKGLKETRNVINGLSVRYVEAINRYTFNYNLPIIDLMIELAQSTETINSALVSSFAQFVHWKERMGRERALGSRGLYSKSYNVPDFCDHMTSLLAEQKSYLNGFKMLASPRQLEIADSLFTHPDLTAIKKAQIDLSMKAPSVEKRSGIFSSYTAQDWFNLMSRIMNKALKIANALINDFMAQQSSRDVQQELPSELASYMPFLKSLAIFSKLPSSALQEILSFGTIREVPKDKLLFLQGENCSRFYVILKGWVKIYNGTEAGDETILQMLSSGDTLLETSILLNSQAPFSAQVVEPVTLLSLPAPVIRQQVQSKNDLAINMLNNVSLRSQNLIHKMEQSQLKSAIERVGWFLLRQYLNQRHDGLQVYLPYDKAVIASYLNMRPETFSRALKKLKVDGFSVTSSSVTLPDNFALCNYCDITIAQKCEHDKSETCPRPDLVMSN